MYDEVNGSVIITTSQSTRIRGTESEDVLVTVDEIGEDGFLRIEQDGDSIIMAQDEAEALFLVLDTMLHHPDAE